MEINAPEIISSEIESEYIAADPDVIISDYNSVEPTADPEEQKVHVQNIETDALTNDVFNSGVDEIVSALDPDAVSEDVFRDYPQFLSASDIDLPDYSVIFQMNGVNIYFPTEYSDDIILVDGMLINLGANYTVGAQIDGYDVSNYLSSEITIPTFHSSTWYQYLQNYGQPYRVVDRYVSNYGSISSSTRDSVSLEFSGGNSWSGFTFERIALLGIFIMVFIIFLFRKGK